MKTLFCCLALTLPACAHSPTTEIRTVERSLVPTEPETLAGGLAPTFQHITEETEVGRDDRVMRVAPGWSIARADDRWVIRAPEGDTTLTVLELAMGSDPGLTAIGAFRRLDPDFSRAVRIVSPAHLATTWDAVATVVFESAPSEQRAVIALVLSKGDRSLVALLDASNDTASRRGSQLNAMITSLRIAGVEDESWAGLPRHELDSTRLGRFAERVEGLRQTAEIPGVAVAIVTADGVPLARGFGVREWGGTQPITPRTLFMIGSTTKALASLLGAVLVDHDVVQWDTPLAQILPQFHFDDAELSRQARLRHAFCACTGLPRRDLEFIFEYREVDAAERMELLGTMRPTSGFGEVFQYSNLMVAAGGFALGHAAEPRRELSDAFSRALTSRVLTPLRMRSTTLSIAEALRREHATPHSEILGGAVAVLPIGAEGGVESVGPAGAAWSNLEDMSRYVRMELARGTLPNGRRFVSEPALMARREPGVMVSRTMHYGLGLFVGTDHGIAFAGHGGNTLGFTSEMTFFPELGVGLVVLSNRAGMNAFNGAISRLLLEALLDLPAEAEARYAESRQVRADAMALAIRETRVATAQDAATWIGRYHSNELGDLELRIENEHVIADVGEWTGRLGVHTHPGGEIAFEFISPPTTGLELQLRGEGDHRSLSIDAPQHPYLFEWVR